MAVIIIYRLLDGTARFQVRELAGQELRLFTDRVIIIDPCNDSLALLVGIRRTIMAHRPIVSVFFKDNDAGILAMGQQRIRQGRLSGTGAPGHSNEKRASIAHSGLVFAVFKWNGVKL